MRIRDGCVSQPRILVVGGDPRSGNAHNIGELALSEEFKSIKRELRGGRYRRFKPIFAYTSTIDELMHHLNKPGLLILHVAAHGVGAASPAGDGSRDLEIPGVDEAGGFCLLDTQRRPRRITMLDLAEMVKSAAPSIRLVVLNTCHSALRVEALRDSVGCVIAVAGPIGDTAAIEFATAFYRALANRRSVGNAFSQAVIALGVKRFPEKDLFQCHSRIGIDADQLHLVPAQGSRRASRRRSSRGCVVAAGVLATALVAAAMGLGLVTLLREAVHDDPPALVDIKSSADARPEVPAPAPDPGEAPPPVKRGMMEPEIRARGSAPGGSGPLQALRGRTRKPPQPKTSSGTGTPSGIASSSDPGAITGAGTQASSPPGELRADPDPHMPSLDSSVARSRLPQLETSSEASPRQPPSNEFRLKQRDRLFPSVPDDSPRELDRVTVQRHFNLYRVQMAACYERRLLVDPTVSGTATVRYLITPAGSVTALTVNGMDGNVSDCIANVVRTIQFPKSGTGIWVTSPLRFKPRDG